MDTPKLDKALARLQSLAASNAPLGSRVTAETNYGQAYQELVRTGQRRQIRKKYRIGGR